MFFSQSQMHFPLCSSLLKDVYWRLLSNLCALCLQTIYEGSWAKAKVDTFYPWWDTNEYQFETHVQNWTYFQKLLFGTNKTVIEFENHS